MPSPAHIPTLLEQAQQFLNDPKKVGGLVAGVAWGLYYIAKFLIKDPTKIWTRKVQSIPPTAKSELEIRMAALELDQAKTRAERAEWRYEEMQSAYIKVQAELDKASGQLVAARTVLEETEEKHAQQCEEIREAWERDIRLRNAQKEAAEKEHLRRIATLEAEKKGLATRLAFFDTQIDQKIERMAASLAEPEVVRPRTDLRTTTPPPFNPKKNPR